MVIQKQTMNQILVQPSPNKLGCVILLHLLVNKPVDILWGEMSLIWIMTVNKTNLQDLWVFALQIVLWKRGHAADAVGLLFMYWSIEVHKEKSPV